MSSSRILLRGLLLSTSRRNIARYSSDKKKKRRAVGSIVGSVFLILLIMGYCVLTCIGYGMYGIIEATPDMCALIISLLAFILTLFKTNGYLFNFKEYDMLMSLPFKTQTVAACKFLYMYVHSLPWYLSVSVSMMATYGWFARPSVWVYPVWLILSLFLPLIPMLLATFFGFVFARISAGFRKRNIVQTVLIFIFILFCFSLRFIIEDLFKNNKIQMTLETTSEITGNTAKIYLPAGWFTGSVRELDIPDMLLLVGVSVILFALVFLIVGRSYRNINSALKSHAARRNFRMTEQKQRPVVWAIAHKEFKRMTGSSNYLVNGTFGMVMSVILGVATLFIGFDRLVGFFTNGVKFDMTILFPAIPFIIHFCVGMVSTTAISPSIEGKNYWIMQSLPIEKTTIYRGKMLFNLCLTVPPMLIGVLCLCISAGVPVLETILYLVLGFVLCCFATTWGCVCGIKHMRLDWENEIEVIKQSSAVAIYLFPNMLIVMGLAAGMVFLGMKMDHLLITGILIAVVSVLVLLSYWRAMSLAKRRG